MRTTRRQIAEKALHAVPVVAFLAMWTGVSALVGSDRLPSPADVIVTAGQSLLADPIIEAQGGGSDGYLPHIGWTFVQFVLGFVVGGLVGTALGLIAGRSRWFGDCAGTALEFLRTVPPLIMVPLVVLLPATPTIETLVIALYAALSLFAYAVEAARNVSRTFLEMARLMGASERRLTFDVLLPAALPELIGALRVTVVISIGIAVVVEYLAMRAGIGRVMKFAISFARIDLIMVGVLWAAVITLIIDVVISMFSRTYLRWHPRVTG